MAVRGLMVTGLAIGLLGGMAPAGSGDAIEIPMLDVAALEEEDIDRERAGLPPRYAIAHEVMLTPANSGSWMPTADGLLQWTLDIESRTAVSINLGFERWSVPPSAEMVLSPNGGQFTLRPFTSNDNADHGQLWTPPVPGERVRIALTVDPADRELVEHSVVLTSINVGYRGFHDMIEIARSGSCNYDVTCPEADGWEDEIACVAVISTGGSTFCSGFMVNNLRNDRTPYFMTANHCGVSGGNAASLVTFWNYQNDPAVNCPGAGNETATLDQFNTGSTYLASYSSSDFTLVELDEQPDQDWEVSYCGWNAADAATDWSVAIHHPATDAKRWSIDYDASQIYGYNGPGDTHLRILDWDLGTTEPGSSGSPMFDPDHRVVGQLHGGYAACGNDLEDWYGRFAVSWTGGGSPTNSLSSHLDPDYTGGLVCDTLPGRGMSVTPATGTTHACTPGCVDVEPSSVTYTLQNTSPSAIAWSAHISGSSFLQFDSASAGSIPAGDLGYLVVKVESAGWANGTYNAVLNIDDLTNEVAVERSHTLEVGLTDFSTEPEHEFQAGGPIGGPFPTTQVYTITSTQPTPTTVRVTASDDWISLNGAEGPLEIPMYGMGDTSDITVGFSGAANDLPAGLAYGSVAFDNLEGSDGDTVRDVVLDVGRFTYTAYDVPIPITDNTEITSTIEVGDKYCVGDLDLELDVTHTFIGDLIIDLEAPTGVVVRLHDRSGGSSDDIVTTYDDDGGTLPDGPGELADLVGEIVTGTWTLRISDNAGADQGSLNAWTLKIASTGDVCPPSAGDVDVATDTNVPVDIELLGTSVEELPLDFVITSLPTDGQLADPGGGDIDTSPYTLVDEGNVVTYTPDNNFYGVDLFTYRTFDGVWSDEAVVTVTVGAIPNPDDCHQAFDLPNGEWDFSTLEATTDGQQHDECQFDGQTYNDIWYRYTACGDGDLIVSTCNTADYDTDLVLYDTTCEGTLLACNDDTSGCETYTSMVTVPVTEGDVLIIRVGGWNPDDMGTGTLLVDGPQSNCPGEPCDGDINGDGTVDVNDILAVIAGYGDPYGVDDILLVLENYGSTC